MAYASSHTLLSLDRFAELAGINPAHFNGAATTDHMPLMSGCNSVWPQHGWQAQNDQVGREELAFAIRQAEYEIARVLGFFPAPMWIAQEVRQFPRHHRPDVFGNWLDSRGFPKSVKTRWAHIVQVGPRATSAVSAGAAVTYSDEDADGFSETATVTAATTLTDACEVKVYFAGKSAAQEWEIRPARTKSISGGTFTATFWTWQLIDPSIHGQLPRANVDFGAVDISVAANLVSTVDIYREYADNTATSARFFWEKAPALSLIVCSDCGGSGCPTCSLTTQDGCAHVKDVYNGIVVPVAATYSASDGAWLTDAPTKQREPDIVKLWYYAGELSEPFLRGDTCEPMPSYLERAIVNLTIARLERPFCGCADITNMSNYLREDLSFSSSDSGTHFTPVELLQNPFGTRRGEVLAWRLLDGIVERAPKFAVV